MTGKLYLIICATVSGCMHALTSLAMEQATLTKIISLGAQEGRNIYMKKCC